MVQINRLLYLEKRETDSGIPCCTNFAVFETQDETELWNKQFRINLKTRLTIQITRHGER